MEGQENKATNFKKQSEFDLPALLKPFLIYSLLLFVPVVLSLQLWLQNDKATFGLVIFLGILFSAMGSVLVIALLSYIKGTYNPVSGTAEDFKRRNGYAPRSHYHAYLELALRAIRIYVAFYLLVSPLSGIYSNVAALAKAALLCLGIFVASTLLIEKTRIR